MSDRPPALDPQQVEKFVANAHGDLDVVKTMLAEEPALVNATWDWGGGDWETALGAAAHMGRRDIALFLLERGARMDVFAAAMLGEVEIVRACWRRIRPRATLPGRMGSRSSSMRGGRRGGAGGRRVARGGGGARVSVVATDLARAVEDAAAHLYVWALKDIPQDLRDALAAAAGKETSVTGQRVLQTILKNVNVAEEEKNLVCQDTGIAVYYCRVGEGFPLHPARIYEALKEGTERATVEHPLRSNTVHTLTRENTGQNVGYRVPSCTGSSFPTGTGWM